MSSLPLATTFKWPKQLSPHSAEDWQFANSDLIPATGVMAFGKSRRTNCTHPHSHQSGFEWY